MAISVGDLYRVSIRGQIAGQLYLQVTHWRAMQSAATTLTATALVNQLLAKAALIGVAMAQAAHNSVTIDSATASAIHASTHLHGGNQDLNLTGAISGELLPGFAAVPVHLYTSFAGRRRRGRIHCGGWTEGDQNAGVLEAAALTRAEAFRDAVLEQMTGGTSGWRGVIYSRKRAEEMELTQFNPGNLEEGHVDSPYAFVTSASVGPILGTMVSRKIGRGA